MNSYLIFFVVVLIGEGLVAKKAENNPVLFFFAVMILINTLFPFWFFIDKTIAPFILINIIFGPMAFLSALGKNTNYQENLGKRKTEDNNDVYEKGNIKSNFDSDYEKGNIESDFDSDYEKGNIESDFETDYNEERGNTEFASEEYSLSSNESNSNMKYDNKTEIDENTKDKDYNKIGYKQGEYDRKYDKAEYENAEKNLIHR